MKFYRNFIVKTVWVTFILYTVYTIQNMYIQQATYENATTIQQSNEKRNNTALLAAGKVLYDSNERKKTIEELKSKLKNRGILDGCAYFRREGKYEFEVLFNMNEGNPAFEDITLITQLNMKRLYMLKDIFDAWKGPVSIALYLDKKDEVPQAKTELAALMRPGFKVQALKRKGRLYPINYLRNVALNISVTRYVLAIDVDFIPSTDTYDNLINIIRTQPLKKQTVLVLPAFAQMSNTTQIPTNKTELLQQWRQNLTLPYSESFNFIYGHVDTNYSVWRTTDTPYVLNVKNASHHFEPYFLIEKKYSPQYNQSFIQRFYDKVSYIVCLRHSRFTFEVHPSLFLVHRKHVSIRNNGPKSLWRCANDVLIEMKKWLKTKKPLFYMYAKLNGTKT